MQLQLKPTNKLTYKLRLTPQMKLAISLLQMPLVKVQEYVQQQIEENPLLEIDPVRNTKSLEGEDKISNGVENKKAHPKEIEDNENSEISNEMNYNSDEDDEEKQNYRQSLITKTVTLSEHLLKQLYLWASSDEERKIGELIIGNIDDNGYFKGSLQEIVKISQSAPSQIQKVLSLIQTFDPIGIGARDLRECLLLQINPVRNTKSFRGENKISNGVKAKGQKDSLAGQIIDKYLPYLEKKRFEFIAKKLSANHASGGSRRKREGGSAVTIEKIKEAIKEIAKLEPKPGRSFNTERAVRLVPDAILRKNNDTYEVILNDRELPSLNLNPKYKRMLKQENITEDTKEYLEERIGAAKFLINAINKRKETIKSVTEAIVYIQKDFLNNGMQYLKPMTLSQIAKLVDKHKSTVSRTVNNKYLQTPDGIFELRHFLNSGIKQKNGEVYSSKAIKSKIKELIEKEDKENPLTDQQIANHFKQKRISISRRTIAKYRHKLKILSSQSRKQ